MLAFACGLLALAFVARRRPGAAAGWTVLGGIVHTSTAIWFAGVVAVAAAWPYRHQRTAGLAAGTAALVGLLALVFVIPDLPRMDAAWLAVLAERDYLFAAGWPIYAWLANLAYLLVLFAIYRRRVTVGAAVSGESGLMAGFVALVAVFLITVPLAELRIAFFVQLQANRVFWILDAVVAIYLGWWLLADRMAGWRPARRWMAIAVLALVAIGRGTYVLHESDRPLVQLAPQHRDWTAAMQWLRTQPASWHVLADPDHAGRYGISLRAAALRDTPLEIGKDPAMAMYDRDLAMRVADRRQALADFEAWTSADQVRRVANRYDIDVFVDRSDRTFPLPTLFRNDSFVVYDLR
jgi:hypothetical protein